MHQKDNHKKSEEAGMQKMVHVGTALHFYILLEPICFGLQLFLNFQKSSALFVLNLFLTLLKKKVT